MVAVTSSSWSEESDNRAVVFLAYYHIHQPQVFLYLRCPVGHLHGRAEAEVLPWLDGGLAGYAGRVHGGAPIRVQLAEGVVLQAKRQ